jgi:hypothetical protein
VIPGKRVGKPDPSSFSRVITRFDPSQSDQIVRRGTFGFGGWIAYQYRRKPIFDADRANILSPGNQEVSSSYSSVGFLGITNPVRTLSVLSSGKNVGVLSPRLYSRFVEKLLKFTFILYAI